MGKGDSEQYPGSSAEQIVFEALRDLAPRAARSTEVDVGSELATESSRAALCGARHVVPADVVAGQTMTGPSVEESDDARLNPRRSRAAAMLARGFSVRATADALGLHRGTLFRWRQLDPTFEREVRRQSRISTAALAARARSLLLKATHQAEISFDREEGSGNFASRLLMNRKLWDVAMSAGEGEADEADEDEGSPDQR